MKHNSVLISGASVAGPALAWWLARRGFWPVIVERSGQLRGGGYAVGEQRQARRRQPTPASKWRPDTPNRVLGVSFRHQSNEPEQSAVTRLSRGCHATVRNSSHGRLLIRPVSEVG